MTARNFALISGIFFVLIGIAGFIPGIVSAPDTIPDGLAVTTGYGYLMGAFPVNLLHNIVHLSIGAWGLSASRSPKGTIFYSQGLTIFYGLLAVMGLLPVLGTSLGLIPIFGNDVLLHLGTAAIASYYGFFAVADAAVPVSETPKAKMAGSSK